jgi:hypothetical protein
MRSEIEFDGSLEDLPAMLTVEEAARVLRIGRSLAYQLATRYLDSGGTDGLPVLRLGGVLRVPGLALRELITTGTIVQLTSAPTTQSRTSASRPRRARRSASPDRAQLSLLSAD